MSLLLLLACAKGPPHAFHERVHGALVVHHSSGPVDFPVVEAAFGDVVDLAAHCGTASPPMRTFRIDSRTQSLASLYRAARRNRDWEVRYTDPLDPRIACGQPTGADLLSAWPGLVDELERFGMSEGWVDWSTLDGHERVPFLLSR